MLKRLGTTCADSFRNSANKAANDFVPFSTTEEFKTRFATLEDTMVSIQESMGNIKTKLSDVEPDNIRLREDCFELRESNKQLNQGLWSTES
ncbi:hypothetical protein J6590_022966 [Homalodisca vitripennis]|nr:hypothetical protein J6590_022966 [Homalodisca vitripennis]